MACAATRPSSPAETTGRLDGDQAAPAGIAQPSFEAGEAFDDTANDDRGDRPAAGKHAPHCCKIVIADRHGLGFLWGGRPPKTPTRVRGGDGVGILVAVAPVPGGWNAPPGSALPRGAADRRRPATMYATQLVKVGDRRARAPRPPSPGRRASRAASRRGASSANGERDRSGSARKTPRRLLDKPTWIELSRSRGRPKKGRQGKRPRRGGGRRGRLL